MHRFSRTVLGYHGCSRSFAAAVIGGDCEIDEWRASSHPWDWLGHGIYFWEYAPERALRWAIDHRKGDDAPAVIGAVIDLGRCFDLAEIWFADQLAATYDDLVNVMTANDGSMPVNSGSDGDLKNRRLDCLVINTCVDLQPDAIQTVRSPFIEGGPAYPGAKLMRESHIQIAVRDRACIVGVFRPTFRSS